MAFIGVWEKTERWYVDHKLAIDMTLKVEYRKNKSSAWTTIVDWDPNDYYSDSEVDERKQWWITGFNPSYVDKITNIDQLQVTYTVRFITKGYDSSIDEKLRVAFKKESYDSNYKWKYEESTKIFTRSF